MGRVPQPRPLDRIRAGLAEVWDTAGRRFVTFEMIGDDGRPDPDLWVQWIDGELNLRWPFDDDPAAGLPRRGVRLPAAASVRSHVPGANAIVGAWDLRIDDTAEFIDAVFRRVLARGPRWDVEARIDEA